VFSDYPEAYEKIAAWVDKYGAFAIFVLALQPCFRSTWPGSCRATRMRATKFWVACFLGRFPKYLLSCYFYEFFQEHLPSWLWIVVAAALVGMLLAYFIIGRLLNKKEKECVAPYLASRRAGPCRALPLSDDWSDSE